MKQCFRCGNTTEQEICESCKENYEVIYLRYNLDEKSKPKIMEELDEMLKKGVCKVTAPEPIEKLLTEEQKEFFGLDKKTNKERHFHSFNIRPHTQELPENEDINVLTHRNICEELNRIYKAKNKDYGDSFSKTYDEFGNVMSAIRLQDKLERFKRLSSGNTANVKDESIKDTLLDLANYAIMTIIELNKR